MRLSSSPFSYSSDVSVGSSSLSSSQALVERGVSVSSKDGGTCSYFAPDENGCSSPRPCVDCLNFNVAAETLGCMVDTLGKCVSVTGNYDYAMDFRNGRASNNNESVAVGTNQLLVFRASDAQYCEAADMECANCRTTVFLKASNSPNALKTTTFCYGENGCVCIAACESTRWSEVVGGTKCPKAYTEAKKEYKPVDDDKHGMAPWEITLVAIAVLLAVLIVVILFKRRRDDQMPGWIQKVISKFYKSSSTPSETTATTTTTVAAGTTASGSGSDPGSSGENGGGPKREGLSLFGWRVMREELIDNESHRLARVDNGDRSPVAGFVQFADTAPSAPAFDDDDIGPGHGNGPSAPPSAPPHDL